MLLLSIVKKVTTRMARNLAQKGSFFVSDTATWVVGNKGAVQGGQFQAGVGRP
jgi:hypothetical protein